MVKVASTQSSNDTGPAERNPHADVIGEAVRKLLSTLPPEQQQQIADEIAREYRLIPASRAGEVLGQVLRLIPRREEFSVEDIKRRVVESGVEAKAKAVYNALSYLKSQGKIRRVGYGRYIVDGGIALNTPEDWGGAPGGNEDESSGF